MLLPIFSTRLVRNLCSSHCARKTRKCISTHRNQRTFMIFKLSFAACRVARKEKQTKHQCDNLPPKNSGNQPHLWIFRAPEPHLHNNHPKMASRSSPGSLRRPGTPQKTAPRDAKGAPTAAQGRFLSGLGETNLAPKSLPETSTRPCGTLRCSILQPPGCGTPRSSILHPPEDDFGGRRRFIQTVAGGTFEQFLALTNLFSYHPRGLPKGSATRTKLTPGASPEYGQKTIKPKSNKLLQHAACLNHE